MRVSGEAFERWRRGAGPKTTLLRLFFGVLLIGLCWFVVTFAVIMGGVLAYGWWVGSENDGFDFPSLFAQFMGSPAGVLGQLLTFAGVWLGVWLAMRFLHREKLGRLFGNSGRISRSGFAKGFLAILIAGIPTEIVLYLMQPVMERGSIAFSSWLLFLPLVAVLALVQTSSEEVLFRGYLTRGLAHRFRSPWIWALLPSLLFTLMHWNNEASPAMNTALLFSIAGFTAMVMALVYATGNLGAAMGAHLGNNLSGFALIAHESTLSSFALFRGAQLEGFAWTPGEAVGITALAFLGCGLALLLLLHPRSPLKAEVDRSNPGGALLQDVFS